MVKIGIISEYNPFHKGHKYQIEKCRELFPDCHIISIMSGNFVQRGEIAMADKYSRAIAACQNGINVCFELPTLYALGSAREFASGAVSLLDKLGVDYICFGAEETDMEIFDYVSDLLVHDNFIFESNMKDNLKAGHSYPIALSMAVHTTNPDVPENFLMAPNNILGLEYICALKRFKSKIKPIIIERIGSGYNDRTINSFGGFSSATAIRAAIKAGNDITSLIPSPTGIALKQYLEAPAIIDNNLLSDLLNYRILQFKQTHADILDMDNDLKNKLLKLERGLNFTEIVKNLKSKNYVETRINRVLMHLLLDIKKSDLTFAKDNSYPCYANLLAARKDSTKLLKEFSESSRLPVVVKKADYTPSEIEKPLWELDKYATDIYSLIAKSNLGILIKPDLSTTPGIVL